MKVDKWRNMRLESIRVHHVNEKGELGKLNIEDEHKLIMDETSKLDKLSDCSAEVPQEADDSTCFASSTYAIYYVPSANKQDNCND